MKSRILGAAFVIGWLAAGCPASETGPRTSPCLGPTPPAGCGVECSGDVECGAGFHCAAGACTAECVPSSGCGPGRTCSTTGRCVPVSTSVGTVDGGGLCASVQIGARRLAPFVTVILDQSGSMEEPFQLQGGGTDSRWNVMRNALIGPEGVITRLHTVVDFGLSLYTAEENPGILPNLPVPGTECPQITSVPIAPQNRDPIATVYEMEEPVDETPTGDAIDAVLANLNIGFDPTLRPYVFILATDGNPDRCEQLNNKGVPPATAQENDRIAREEATDAVSAAFQRGIRTYVLGVEEGTVALDHLQDLANAGLGRTTGDPAAPFWVAGDEEGLITSLTAILGESLSCEVELEGRIDVTQACSGTVTLNDDPLVCDDPDGWRVVDDDTIEIVGAACDRLKNEPAAFINALFPCQAVLI